MFNVGGPEIMVVLLVALVVLGPDQLPKAMRTFGNVMAQVRKVSNGFQDEMRNAMNTIESSTSMPTSSSTQRPGGGDKGTEVVVRNDGSGTPTTDSSGGTSSTGTSPSPEKPPSDASPTAPAVDPVSDRPGISAADRAAG